MKQDKLQFYQQICAALIHRLGGEVTVTEADIAAAADDLGHVSILVRQNAVVRGWDLKNGGSK